MPDPVTMGTVALQAAPFIMSLFGGGPEEVDYEDTLRRLVAEFTNVLGPEGEALAREATRQGAITGSAMSQDMADSVGRVGGGSAGATRAARGLASSSASTLASQGSADARMKVASMIAELAAQTLPSAVAAQGQQKLPTGYQNMLQGLAGVTAADGQNPFVGLLNQIMKQSGPGEQPFDLGQIIGSPLLQTSRYNQSAPFGSLKGGTGGEFFGPRNVTPKSGLGG